MSKTEVDGLSSLKALDRRVRNLSLAQSVLAWDQETYLPDEAVEGRSEQMAELEGLVHQLSSSDELGKTLDALGLEGGFDAVSGALVRDWKKKFQRSLSLPASLVQAKSRHISLSQAAWVKARKASDFRSFAPYLETMVGYLRETSDCWGWTAHPYDPLLDEYEPGMTTAQTKELFGDLQQKLTPFLQRIQNSQTSLDDGLLHQSFPQDQQKLLGHQVLTDLGFDWNRGRLDTTTHPFCTTLGDDDIRLTTRYDPQFFSMALYGMIHEAGHGMYEQGFGPDIRGTSLARGTSLGIHESQSRFWENMIGRSRSFSSYLYTKAIHHFPALKASHPQNLHQALNKVSTSLIRVEADEVTYNLHVILRFQIETALMDGTLAVSEVPERWNALMEEFLGVVPPSDDLGCLQDVHWSMGGIGYFPTYTLGNLYSAQIRSAMTKELGSLDPWVERGEFAPILEWLRKNIHQHGAVYQAPELIVRATGQALSSSHFFQYLEEKYGELYDL